MESEDALKAVRGMEAPAQPESEVKPKPSSTPAWQRYLLLVLVAVVVGSVAGYFYARTDPRAAAGTVVANFVVDEPVVGGADGEDADPDAVVPSSGSRDGRIRCGFVDEAVTNDDHLTSLAAGVVVVRYDPSSLDDGGVAALRDLVVDRDRILVSPEPRLEDSAIEVVAWGKRVALPRVNLELLTNFHRAYEGTGPTPGSCPG